MSVEADVDSPKHGQESRAQYHTGINDQIPARHRFNYNVTTKMSSFLFNNLKKTFKV